MSLIYTAPSSAAGGATSTSSRRRNSVYLGSKSDAKDRSKLERFGVTHILNVTPEKEAGIKAGVANFFEKKKVFTYRRISVYDNATSDLLQYAPSIVSFISNALHYGSILVHCQRGVSRSTTCVLFYLMNKVGMDLDNALALVKQRRPEADPIPAFLEQLKRYEGECKDLGLIKKDSCDNGGDGNGVSNASTSSKASNDASGKRQGRGDGTNLKKRKADGAQITIGPSRGPVGPQQQQKVKKILGPSRGPSIGPTLPPPCKTEDAAKKRGDNN
mmetsp:Transcript_4123/g.5989  ORF Transcript_4123/g.5989 Transcript_4123/m.5989 type:complete len:273 (-) Transcript_4123:90-908(-)